MKKWRTFIKVDEKLKLTLGIKFDERLSPSMDREIFAVEDPQCSSYLLKEAAHSTSAPP